MSQSTWQGAMDQTEADTSAAHGAALAAAAGYQAEAAAFLDSPGEGSAFDVEDGATELN